ncbi:MAG: hypothetical protein ACKVXR_18765 [Planctomycetota bacterium]
MNNSVGLLVVLAGLLLGGTVTAQSKVPISWKGKKLDAAALPKDLGPAPAAAIAQWEPWAKAAGYRMELDANGRMLVLSRANGSRGVKVLQIAGGASTWFDEVLPKPPPRTGEANATPAGAVPSSPEVIPEDPEAPPAGAENQPKPKKNVSSWGSGSLEPDSQTATLIALADEADQKSLLEFIKKAKPELAEWAAQASKELGFVLEIPLVAAYVESASGQEEWNPDHEVLNRAVRLLTLRRFGQLPNWLVHGIAWEAEHAHDGSIWVYPYRDEFVYTTEHTAWPLELASEFKNRRQSPLQIEELTDWKPRTWDGACARHAFGFVHYLTSSNKARMSDLLEDFRRYRDANNRKPSADESWTRDPNWEPPPQAQAAILRARFGEGVFEEASAWLVDPAPPRARTNSKKK